ncbi:MAG: hypothetical protein RSB95_04885 [Bacilli bacterium]
MIIIINSNAKNPYIKFGTLIRLFTNIEAVEYKNDWKATIDNQTNKVPNNNEKAKIGRNTNNALNKLCLLE